MAYRDDLNQFMAANPDETGVPNPGVAPPSVDAADPLVQATESGGGRAPAPAYQGLTGDPYQTAIVTSAQLAALTPPPETTPARADSAPCEGAGPVARPWRLIMPMLPGAAQDPMARRRMLAALGPRLSNMPGGGGALPGGGVGRATAPGLGGMPPPGLGNRPLGLSNALAAPRPAPRPMPAGAPAAPGGLATAPGAAPGTPPGMDLPAFLRLMEMLRARRAGAGAGTPAVPGVGGPVV